MVDRPRQRVCGRIFASEQHGHEIRHDHVVGKGLALFVDGGQHRLEEIGRPVGAVGIRLQAGARIVHEAAEPGADILNARSSRLSEGDRTIRQIGNNAKRRRLMQGK